MYAVIKSGGKQYRVAVGQKLKLEKLTNEVGETVKLEDILMVVNGGDVSVGTPTVEGADVEAKVLAHGRHRKINIIKFKRRKHHMKRQGHRQYFTEVEITKIGA